MLTLTTLDEDTSVIAERLSHAHEQVRFHADAYRKSWDERAALARELHRVREYPCSRIARELGVVERTVWTWVHKSEKEGK